MARERQRITIGSVDEFPAGQMKLISANGREIGVIRLHSGELRAVMNRCPHKGAPICRGIVGGVWDSTGPGELMLDKNRSTLVCPWHGFEFDLETGKEVCWRRPASLRMYRVEESAAKSCSRCERAAAFAGSPLSTSDPEKAHAPGRVPARCGETLPGSTWKVTPSTDVRSSPQRSKPAPVSTRP